MCSKNTPFQTKEELIQQCSKIIIAEKPKKTTSDIQTTIEKMKEKKSTTYLKADKSNSIVAIDVQDYNQRIEDLINEGPYEEITYNPLSKMINSVRSSMNNIKSKYGTTFDMKFTVSNPKVPRLYGLPKTHKPGNKMRPIVSNNDAPTEKIAKWINQEFEKLPKPPGLYVSATQLKLWTN
jgi:hypothetical protein